MGNSSPDQPSTAWREVVTADEAERFARYAQSFAELQERKSRRYGTGRALHRKQLLGAHAELQVLPDLPEFAAQGLFAKPATYAALVRLSNGGMDKASDRQPDVRGFGLAVLGVQGQSALGPHAATRQCFALINQSQFAFPQSAEFVDFVLAAAEGKGALLKYLIHRYGLLGGPKRLLKLAGSLGRPFAGFAHESFFSAAPIACGPYAVRVRLVPLEGNGAPDPDAGANWGDDMRRRLATQALRYRLELQPFVSEERTPIEDASVNWPTAYTPVATLTLPVQALGADDALAQEVEQGVFDPWAALQAHRPLGDVMRARKVVYYQSQQGRGAVN